MFNFVFAGFNAKIKINENFFNVEKNTLQPIDENFDGLTIFAPHCKEAYFVPYTINKNECNVYKHNNLNANIFCLKPNYFLKQNCKTQILDNKQISALFITRGKCFLKIRIGENAYTEQFAELCENPQIILNGNFLIVYAKNCLCDGYSVLAFNINTKTFCFNTPTYEIKEENNELCIVDYPVITGAAKASIYNLNSSNFSATESYYVKLFNPQKTAENTPLLLFYAVKTKDFNFAKSLLSSALATSATSEMLESYFMPYTDMYKNPFKKGAYILTNKTSLYDIEFSLTPDLLVDNFNNN